MLVKPNNKVKSGLSYDCFLCDVCVFWCTYNCGGKSGNCPKLFN